MSWRRSSAAQQFAEAHFGGCAEHTRQALAVHRSLERISRQPMRDLDPDLPIGSFLPPSARAQSEPVDSLDAVELAMALEAEFAPTQLVAKPQQLADTRVMMAMLGDAISSCTWDASTIRLRSMRGIINERVRHAPNECTCVE